MRAIFLTFLLLTSLPASAVELFGVPLANADKGNLGFAVKRAGATLQETERNQVYEVFDSSNILDASFRLYLGFDVQTGQFGFAEYHLHRMAHQRMLNRLTEKYGPPRETPGEFLTDQLFEWQVDGIDIRLHKTRGCNCSRLLYTEPATFETVKQQHAQVQQQRADEAAEKFLKAY